MSFLLRPVQWFYNEFGVASVYNTGRNVWFIILGRTCRMFAFGANSLIFALFFSSLEFSDIQIGLFMTLTLLGDMFLSLALTLVADRVGRRRVLFGGACLMVVSGIIFVVSENFWILLSAAVIGVVSATGSDFGPFRAIEESVLSHLTTPKTRSDVLSWYVALSNFGAAAGTEFSGRAIDFLKNREGWTITGAYHAIFGLYLVMGVMNIIFAVSMTNKCEVDEASPLDTTEAAEGLLGEEQHTAEDNTENSNGQAHAPETPPKKSVFAQISSQTRRIMYKLWFLLCVDSIADGMVSSSLTSYYTDRKLHLSKSHLGDIWSASYFVSAASTVFAGPLSRHLGLIKTMVFTHLPSSAAVLLYPIPQGVVMTVILLFIRTGLNNMDQAPRSTFIAGVVKPEERTAVMGVTGVLRTLATLVGPTLTGSLADNDQFWVAFVVAGTLRICYDLGLFVMFVNTKLHLHEKEDGGSMDVSRESDEEESIELKSVEGDSDRE